MKTTDVGKRTKYEGYKSFDYLEPGTDYREFKLAKELDRVPSRKVEVNDSQIVDHGCAAVVTSRWTYENARAASR